MLTPAFHRLSRAALLAVTLAGCASDPTGDDALQIVPAAAPQLLSGDSKADVAGDRADHDCQLVLDHAGRVLGTGGVNVVDGLGWYVFDGDIRAREVPAEATVNVLFSTGQGWFSARAVRADAAGSWHFRLDRNTIRDGISFTSLSRIELALIPYLEVPGGRIFDHNRIAGDFDTYVLAARNDWKVAADGSCPTAAPRTANLRFTPDWRTEQRGALSQGGSLTIDYAVDRLTACRGTHNGFPAWDVRAFVRFSNGTVADGSVRAFRTNMGTPTTMFDPVPFTTAIPRGATSADIWFQNTGINCSGYDSNLGANYHFDVVPPPAAPLWAGDVGGSFSRSCDHRDILADERIDSYVMERACMRVEADVYVPGTTDAPVERPAHVIAEAVWSLDTGELRTTAMTFVSRVGNNYRYRWEIPRWELRMNAWTHASYRMRFTTDGKNWVEAEGGARGLTRDFQ